MGSLPQETPLIFIFDQLRTRSHLFHRFLSTHPQLTPLWHPYLKAAFFGSEDRHTKHSRNSDIRNKENDEGMLPFYGNDTYESCAAELEQAVIDIGKEGDGEKLLVNEHMVNILKQDLMFRISRSEHLGTIPANPTVIPDSLYHSLTPIMLIRNPLHQVRSSYSMGLHTTQMRPGDEDFHHTTTLSFSRFLYDHLVSEGRKPIVVDGEDTLWRTKQVAEAVCARMGLDPKGVSDSWEPIGKASYASGEPIIQEYMGDILGSTGVRREGQDPGEPKMEIEFAKWKKEFGDDVAQQLKEIAEKVMPDYEYLRQFKV